MLLENLSKKWVLPILLSIATLSLSCSVYAADKRPAGVMRDSCVLIDNDFDIDDMMAIPLVIGNKHVAAIIQSEGYTLPEQGAAAINQLVNNIPDQPNQRKIPIIVGGKQAQSPDLSKWFWIEYFRAMMNQANALLPTPPKPFPTDSEYVKKVSQSVANCQKVSVLIIGTYTSFINYAPTIKSKIDRVVIMGQPIGDNSRTQGRESFNCNYDLTACKTAMGILKDMNVYFVDIPRDEDVGGICADTLTPSPNCYNPSHEMVVGGKGSPGLLDTGLPGRLKQALTNKIDCNDKFTKNSDPKKTMPKPAFLGSGLSNCTALSIWVPANVSAGPGGEMLFWDQTAALFLLHPEYFSKYYPPKDPSQGGKHYEANLVNGSYAETAEFLRQLWTKDTNKAINRQ
ncbi:inosine-uridine nucleoside N-ribohydrolase [Polynucleobacter sphagniphilus]|jgi:inosine-uridine nucleoside N-ribohydrolase|uniref:Inosine-uridine nucleoside N-ribohydrolase n=1 Tax=Polynucleobacter sphagniphilus TaxID=1743169 RepID=A0AA43S694_9BURK|nr:nucleoside hydrolase [Polynucleobacter sphagniphilus]MDH6249648.1 inosine-uridine nucleoside N-ribohydrolase [Polynucleobacter sphagniphilus]MDH6503606.1 inosine-uridine nucleoside N-ribohydrolase [Polynucleobacter sphagniphilus]MDH6512841.1 inosine-uridine nucleoside N-ribohydrolase [Polynucleobacter sphagniphilus]